MQQICSSQQILIRYVADMEQICSRYGVDMQQICSRYAADMQQIFIKLLTGLSIGSILAKYSIIEELGEERRRRRRKLLDSKKHSTFIDMLKNAQ